MEQEKTKLTNDIAFQLVFGKPGNERITKNLIESLLGIQIESLTLNTNKRMYGDFIDDKMSRLDVKAVLNDGTKVLIEMQVSTYDELPERFLYYWGKGYTEDLKSGDKYKELHKTISIIILVNNLPRFKDIEDYHTEWVIQDKKTGKHQYSEYLVIHTFELQKFNGTADNERQRNWLNLIKEGEIDLSKTVDEELKEAIAELEKITSDPATRELYARKEEGLRDYIFGLASERRAGLKEGRKQGLEQGRKESKVEIIKSMHKKGISIQDISEIVRLSKDEVQKILED